MRDDDAPKKEKSRALREAAERVKKYLEKTRKTLAAAESCTGGLVADTLTDIPGISACFAGGVVAYADEVKVSVLGVSPDVIREHGAVSGQTAVSMARGARRLLGADIAAAVTGIAGPGGGTEEKPVGLVYLALASESGECAREVMFAGDRTALKEKFALALLELVLEHTDLS